jgi:hypothetical protein
MSLYIDHVNTVLSKLREPVVTALATNADVTAFMVQVAVQRAVNRVWNSRKWTFKKRQSTMSTVADQAEYVFPKVVGETYSILSQDSDGVGKSVDVYPEETIDQKVPDPQASGWPKILGISDELGVETQPSSASVISVVSSSSSDTTQIVVIRGVVSGETDVEEVSLNGTNAVSTTKSFSSILAVSKSATSVGRVTLTSNSGVVTNVVIAPQEKTTRLRKVRFLPTPDAVYSVIFKHFAKPPILTTRYEDTEIPVRWDYIVDQYAFALALQAKGKEQSEEFALQMQLADKMLEADMATEESESSETIIILNRALMGRRSPFSEPPSGYGFEEF